MSSRYFLHTLSSFAKEIWLVKNGEHINKTADDHTSIGLIILQHENRDIIENDVKQINERLSDIFMIDT